MSWNGMSVSNQTYIGAVTFELGLLLLVV